MRCTPTQYCEFHLVLYERVSFCLTNDCVCVFVYLCTLQATEQFASDILREALAGAYAKSPQNRSDFFCL